MSIYDLLDHLKKCPIEFQKQEVSTHALVGDVYRKITGDYTFKEFNIPKAIDFKNYPVDYRIAIQISCWLLSYHKIKGDQNFLNKINTFLFDELSILFKYVKSPKWIEDDDRSEELIRLFLNCCNIILEGENMAEAADRFESLSTIKRLGVLEKSKAAYDRMMEIRRKLAAEKAREAANPYGRE